MVVQRELIDNNVYEQKALWLMGEEDHEWEHHFIRILERCKHVGVQ